jgi:Mn2+/Fe2+ NRAMP family transporter
VSHLVQSTTAGAKFGYLFIVFIVLAHFFKYPFFTLSHRYVNHCGENLLHGLSQVGKWSVWLIFSANLVTMFLVQSAVTIVTAGLASTLFGNALSLSFWIVALLIICFTIVKFGGHKWLNKIMKPIMVLLVLTTIAAFTISFIKLDYQNIPLIVGEFSISKKEDLNFFLSFLGWMPAPIDIVIWQSIWMMSHQKIVKNNTSNSSFDFNLGYFGTALMAILFLVLGANVLGTQQIQVKPNAIEFATQLAEIYTQNMGGWSYYLILIAAFTTMFSTTLTCFDALSNLSAKCVQHLPINVFFQSVSFWQISLGVGTVLILVFLKQNMREMVQIATISSFIVTPIIAYCFIKLEKISSIPLWSKLEKRIAQIGLWLLSLFAIVFLYSLF